MQLSDGEKLIIAMLCDVYESLGIKDGAIDATRVKSAIHHGHAWAIKEEYQLLLGDHYSRDDVKETGSILSMWNVIDRSISNLSEEEKKWLESKYPNATTVFEGFDANNDPHFFIAEFMIEDLNNFPERKGGVMNSHSASSLVKYRRMLSKYRDILKENSHYGVLTVDQIDRIFEYHKE